MSDQMFGCHVVAKRLGKRFFEFLFSEFLFPNEASKPNFQTRARDAWWRAVLDMLLVVDLDVSPEHVEILRQKQRVAKLSSQEAVQQLLCHPPQYACLLRFNPAVSRDKAIEAIRLATNSSFVLALWRALTIGHPALRAAPDETGTVAGEIMRGTKREVLECISKLETCCSELEARCQWIDYQFLVEEGSCLIS
jgi:hypothetical protein